MDKTVKEYVQLLDEGKCEDIVVKDVKGITYLADYFMIASVNNKPHAEAMLRKIDEKHSIESEAMNPYFHVEGRETGEWVLVDTGDIVIHLFQKETRKFYNLDALWGDAKQIDISDCLIK